MHSHLMLFSTTLQVEKFLAHIPSPSTQIEQDIAVEDEVEFMKPKAEAPEPQTVMAVLCTM
jgi:hypothetical protein